MAKSKAVTWLEESGFEYRPDMLEWRHPDGRYVTLSDLKALRNGALPKARRRAVRSNPHARP